MKILTPAKINPLLYILGKRKDGFHELYMHMVPVSLFDKLSFSNNNKKGLIFQIKGATFSEPTEDNLVVRAVRLFEEATGVTVRPRYCSGKTYPLRCGSWRRQWKRGRNSSGTEQYFSSFLHFSSPFAAGEAF